MANPIPARNLVRSMQRLVTTKRSVGGTTTIPRKREQSERMLGIDRGSFCYRDSGIEKLLLSYQLSHNNTEE
jgi:hypothetical protein